MSARRSARQLLRAACVTLRLARANSHRRGRPLLAFYTTINATYGLAVCDLVADVHGGGSPTGRRYRQLAELARRICAEGERLVLEALLRPDDIEHFRRMVRPPPSSKLQALGDLPKLTQEQKDDARAALAEFLQRWRKEEEN